MMKAFVSWVSNPAAGNQYPSTGTSKNVVIPKGHLDSLGALKCYDSSGRVGAIPIILNCASTTF